MDDEPSEPIVCLKNSAQAQVTGNRQQGNKATRQQGNKATGNNDPVN